MSSTAIPPAPPPLPAPIQAAAVPVLTVVAGSDSGGLAAALPTGALVTVSVQAMEGKVLLQVATASGASLDLKLPPSLQLPSGLQLSANADLTLQLVQQGGMPAFRLLAINGRPLAGGGPLAGAPPLPGAAADPLLAPGGGEGGGGNSAALALNPAASQTGRGAAVTLAPLGQTGMGGPAPLAEGPLAASGPLGLTATVVRPAPAGAAFSPGADGQPAATPAPPPGFADLPPGTQLTVRIASITPSDAAPPPPPAMAGAAPASPAAAQGMPPMPSPLPGSPAASAAASGGTGERQPGGGQQNGPPSGTAPPDPAASPPQSSAAPGAAAPAVNPPAPNLQPHLPSPGLPQSSVAQSSVAQSSVAQSSVAQSAAASASASPTVTLTGTVIAHSPGGSSLIQTPAGLLSLPGGPAMAAGDSVRLDVVRPPVPPPAGTGPAEQQGLGPNGWPALSTAADVLAQADRLAADQLIRMIPQANPRLAAAMAVFAGAVQSGDFKKLGGEGAIKGLDKAGRRDLVDRLKRDFLDLADEAQRPRGAGDWQVVTLPFAHGASIDPIHLYLRRLNEGEDQGGKPGQEQRFILDVRLSRLGRIQFDGLVSRPNKRFDLIVRTAEPLGAEICRDISGIFAECGQLTGITGTVGFQSGRSFVELPPCDAKGTLAVV